MEGLMKRKMMNTSFSLQCDGYCLPLLSLLVLMLFQCAKEPGGFIQDNPLDPNGTNWHPPVVKAMQDTNVAIIDSFYIHAVGVDTNGNKIERFFWALDGVTYKDSTDSGKIRTVFKTAGKKTVCVEVRDNYGRLSMPDSVQVIVHLYAPTVVVMSDTTVAITDSFFIHAVGGDTNGTIKKYVWALDGVNFKDSTDSGRIKTAFTSPGGKKVLVKVRDDDGIESAVVSVFISIYIYQPHVTALFWYVWGGVHDTDVAINDSFFIHAVGSDTNGTIKKYLWALDGVTYKDSTDSGSIKTAFSSMGMKTIRVEVRDNYGQISKADSVQVTVLIPGVISIITQPKSQSVAPGQNVTFSVTAIGTGTLSYQWYKDSTAISGAISSSYSISNVQAANAGTYTVTVSNGTLPNSTSNEAVLTLVCQWTAVNSGLTNSWIYALAVAGNNIFAGTNYGIFLSTNNGTSWAEFHNNNDTSWHFGTVYSLAVSGSHIFAGTYAGGVFLSTNNGSSWATVNNGLTNDTVWCIAVSGNNIFAGTDGGNVYLTTNNGTSWSTLNSHFAGDSVWSLAVSGSNIFASDIGKGVFLSTNNGASWTTVNNGLTNDTVWCFAVSGNNIFAGTADGIFLSTNNGASWTAVNNGLVKTNVGALVVSGNTIFAGTDVGVFLSTNNGTSWTAVNNGLTNAWIQSLVVVGNNIFAGTWGGGVFVSPLP